DWINLKWAPARNCWGLFCITFRTPIFKITD
ncbi:MAG: hypothetical protein ACI8PD_000518, partial [Nitrospinales bacterium]